METSYVRRRFFQLAPQVAIVVSICSVFLAVRGIVSEGLSVKTVFVPILGFSIAMAGALLVTLLAVWVAAAVNRQHD